MSEHGLPCGSGAPPQAPEGVEGGGCQSGERDGGDREAHDVITEPKTLPPAHPTTNPDHNPTGTPGTDQEQGKTNLTTTLGPSDTAEPGTNNFSLALQEYRSQHQYKYLQERENEEAEEDQPSAPKRPCIEPPNTMEHEAGITDDDISLALREYRNRHRRKFLQEKADEESGENQSSAPKHPNMRPTEGNPLPTPNAPTRDTVTEAQSHEIFIKPHSLFSNKPRDLKNPYDRRAMMTPSLYVHGALKMMRQQKIPYAPEDPEIMRERAYNILRGSNYLQGRLVTFRSNGTNRYPVIRLNPMYIPSATDPDDGGVGEEGVDTEGEEEEEGDDEDWSDEEEDWSDDDCIIPQVEGDIIDIQPEDEEGPQVEAHEVEPDDQIIDIQPEDEEGPQVEAHEVEPDDQERGVPDGE